MKEKQKNDRRMRAGQLNKGLRWITVAECRQHLVAWNTTRSGNNIRTELRTGQATRGTGGGAEWAANGDVPSLL